MNKVHNFNISKMCTLILDVKKVLRWIVTYSSLQFAQV
jgi:hypothetical protein